MAVERACCVRRVVSYSTMRPLRSSPRRVALQVECSTSSTSTTRHRAHLRRALSLTAYSRLTTSARSRSSDSASRCWLCPLEPLDRGRLVGRLFGHVRGRCGPRAPAEVDEGFRTPPSPPRGVGPKARYRGWLFRTRPRDAEEVLETSVTSSTNREGSPSPISK